jgi:tetratricopeptide (TPR) repeat protein
MDPTAHQLVQALFAEALKRPQPERDQFLSERCDDQEVRSTVLALLTQQTETVADPETEVPPVGPQAVDDLSDLRPGRQVGPYTIIDRLGRGGMGQVFLGSDPRLQRNVALKCLIPSFSHYRELQAKILHEARAAASINHPNVAAIHDVVTEGPRAFIVMEYVEGESLAKRLQRGPLPLGEVFTIGRQLAAALIAAHAKGVIHRDLKPANIQLTPSGPVKVLDFGVAKALPETTDTTTLGLALNVESGQPGTPAYMSPEQRLGHDVDERSDIYSVGVILFEMATGRRPSTDTDPVARVSDSTRSPEGVSFRRARAFDAVVARALQLDPVRRFQSAAELASALEQLEARSRHRVRVAPWWFAVAAAALLAIGVPWLLRPQPSAPVPPAAVAGERRTIAVFPPENTTGAAITAEWPTLIQSLLVSDLTGAPDLAVMDPLGLNSLVADRAPGAARTDRPTLDLLRRAHVGHVIDGRIIQIAAGYRLTASVVDTTTGENRFSARAEAADERALPEAVGSLAVDVLTYLQIAGLLAAHDTDLRPWISLKAQKTEAVKAFVEASQYIYGHDRDEGEKYLRRAIELDPNFIAPKIWLIPALERTNRLSEAQSVFRSLQSLEATASPFERAMTAYVGARLRGDRAAQARELNVALGYSPGNNILLLELASLRFAAGDCAGALETMRPSIEIHWPFPALYPLFAWCAIERDRLGEAREAVVYSRRFRQAGVAEVALLEALAIAVDDAESAEVYRKEFAERVRGSPNLPISSELMAAYDRLGLACIRDGRLAAAVVLLTKAVAVDPDTASHHELLGQAYAKLGDRTRADEERKKVESLHGDKQQPGRR